MSNTRLDHEMITPALGAPFFAEHLARYHFACRYTKQLRVLDVACGKGYGSVALATVASHVTGIDLDDDNLRFAREHYAHPRVDYKSVDVTKLGASGGTYDTLVAFEIIEHLKPEDSVPFLRALAACLKPGGVALISTPNHAVVKASGVEIPRFHINNLTAEELKAQLSQCFAGVEMYGQFQSKGPLGDLLYALDIFQLRHLGVFRKVRNLSRALSSKSPSPSTADPFPPPFFWRPEHGWGESDRFVFSKRLWKQAGLSVAVCHKGFA